VVLRQDFLVMAPEKLYIGDDVSFAVKVSIMGGCRIGQGSMIATCVTILTTQHGSTASIMRKTGIHRPVTIGKEVWIGAGVIILPGVSIGDNSIVASGAVVTHDVELYQVVGGVPAKFLWDRRSPK
jgi:maltose O-acetyltransferase